ncbi:MAG TPA: RDD family protein, partial [Mycobacterium sp.]|nr:RDD family protein [Mycobacterium sp.]
MVGQHEAVVTGDAVVLDVQVAQLPVRAVAALIDITVVALLYMIGILLWALTLTDLDPALSGAVLIIFTAVTLLGYPVT